MTPYDLATRYIGIREIPGETDHPLIRWWHSLTTIGEVADEVAWCSSFCNGVCWELRRPRSKSSAARSWLGVGVPVPLDQARVGSDIVILSRGAPPSGHVGFFAGWEERTRVGANDARVYILSGNQSDEVSVQSFARSRILGIRRV